MLAWEREVRSLLRGEVCYPLRPREESASLAVGKVAWFSRTRAPGDGRSYLPARDVGGRPPSPKPQGQYGPLEQKTPRRVKGSVRRTRKLAARRGRVKTPSRGRGRTPRSGREHKRESSPGPQPALLMTWRRRHHSWERHAILSQKAERCWLQSWTFRLR